MANNYFKFYKFLQFFQTYSDEDHILTTKYIQEHLFMLTGDKVDRRTVYEYIEVLRSLGYDISDFKENGIGYYIRNRNFEEHEVRILMDCVSACRSITHKKTKELISKLESLNSKYVTNKLKKQLYIDNRSKASNQQIFYNIDSINRAIINNKKISFNYYHHDINKRLVKRMQDGIIKLYIVNPVAMILKRDAYYLVCVSEKYREPSHYRIDRMQMVTVEEEERAPIDMIDEFKGGFDVASYSKKCVNMYSGKDCYVRIKFKNSLLDAVIDEMGQDVQIKEDHDGNFIAGFTVKDSTGLIRWIMQYGSAVKVLEPISLVEKIKKELKKTICLY